jgi:SAM-dependent methyltransferase
VDLYERAWSSSDSAAGYEWARPAYPDDAVEFLGEVLHIGPGSIVLDVGAGTGKLSRNVVRLGCKLIAIEPLPEMRDQFRDAVVGIDVLDGTAEALPVDVESVDAIVAGQAWHWFDSWAAVVEAERVLRPGGGVGLLWNEYDESVRWIKDIAGLGRESKLRSQSPSTREWRTAFDGRPRWTDLEEVSFPHVHSVSRDQVVGRVMSSSVIAALTLTERARFAQRAREILDSHQDARETETVLMPYRTQVFWSRYRA